MSPAVPLLVLCLLVFLEKAGVPGALTFLVDRLLYGVLFFCWLEVSLSRVRPIADTAVPLAFFCGSLLCLGGFLSASLLQAAWREGFEALSAALLVLCARSGGGSDAGAPSPLAEKPLRFSLRSWALRYGVLLLGAVAFAFVFGVMTDLHGWMGDALGAAAVQAANSAAALVLAAVFAWHRRPFRLDAVIILVVPVFAAAILASSVDGETHGLPRLGIMVGYLAFWIAGWVFILREQRALGIDGILTLSLLCSAMQLFSQAGRATAARFLADGSAGYAELSSLSLSLVWVMIIVAAGAYWFARNRDVQRDLETMERVGLEPAPATSASPLVPGEGIGKSNAAASSGEDLCEEPGDDQERSPGGVDASQQEDTSSTVVVDRTALQAERLRERIGLSARETEVLAEFARGRSAAVIAERLFVSRNTVKTHLRRIYEKAGIHSRQELLDLLEEPDAP